MLAIPRPYKNLDVKGTTDAVIKTKNIKYLQNINIKT
jgi:hypothetical protein